MTFFETAGQGIVFRLLLYAGAAAGLLYDLLSLPRRRLPRALAAALDVCWCLLCALLCLFALALGGENHLRLYALLGMACGAGIYCLGIRRIVLGILQGLKKILSKKKADGNP